MEVSLGHTVAAWPSLSACLGDQWFPLYWVASQLTGGTIVIVTERTLL